MFYPPPRSSTFSGASESDALEALDFDPKTVDVHIHWLRLKLEADPAHPTLITTVRGRGYCLG